MNYESQKRFALKYIEDDDDRASYTIQNTGDLR